MEGRGRPVGASAGTVDVAALNFACELSLQIGGQEAHGAARARERLEKAVRIYAGNRKGSCAVAAAGRVNQPVARSGFDEA